MLTKEDYLRDLSENIYCRLGVSKIHGVGIFAVRDIPTGVNPFQRLASSEDYEVKIPIEEIRGHAAIAASVKKIVDDFYAQEDGCYVCPPFGLNEMPISYFANQSKKPNIRLLKNDEFVTLRKIKTSEELTTDYQTFSD